MPLLHHSCQTEIKRLTYFSDSSFVSRVITATTNNKTNPRTKKTKNKAAKKASFRNSKNLVICLTSLSFPSRYYLGTKSPSNLRRDATCPIIPRAATGGAPAPARSLWSPLTEPAYTHVNTYSTRLGGMSISYAKLPITVDI